MNKRITKLSWGLVFISAILLNKNLWGQDVLPPVPLWNGKSVELVGSSGKWITPVERSEFNTTPSYEQTMSWLMNLCAQTKTMQMVPIGKSLQGRTINMVVASQENAFTPDKLRRSSRPLLLIQAGIHAGEIDGKDAGMMLLRDIAFGKKKDLLAGVNILFIPILNVDGHERTSPFNRVNQRGPDNMGWRTNARNLNLNRDYTKLDTEEIRSVVKIINTYEPDLYLDLHVTDGADYQYDITYGFSEVFSPSVSEWLKQTLTPAVDKHLQDYGHIPGPLVFATNDVDFTEGMTEFGYSARFSNGYGDIRHLPTILVENHSLKPFRQRVLGTYVFLESIINVLGREGVSLKKAIAADRALRFTNVPLTWKKSDNVDTITFLGIESVKKKSAITDRQYVSWTGKPVTQRIPFIRYNDPDKVLARPAEFWIPGVYKDVIQRIRDHGIIVEDILSAREVDATFFKIGSHLFSQRPIEGHFTVSGEAITFESKEIFYPGSVRIKTDQPLGNLAIHLLHPESPDSFFQWGFFPEIFTRTEYIEEYVSEPLAEKMLAADSKLREAFELMKRSEPDFANNPEKIYQWFYERSPYYDKKWMVYPIGFR